MLLRGVARDKDIAGNGNARRLERVACRLELAAVDRDALADRGGGSTTTVSKRKKRPWWEKGTSEASARTSTSSTSSKRGSASSGGIAKPANSLWR
jgi:hypothetical protein